MRARQANSYGDSRKKPHNTETVAMLKPDAREVQTGEAIV